MEPFKQILNMRYLIITIVVALIFLTLNSLSDTFKDSTKQAAKQQKTSQGVAGVTDTRQRATLVKVIDGDTIRVLMNGKKETVRVIGINTPEVVDPRKRVECFGKEASQMARDYLRDERTVLLEVDPSQSDRDRYQRLLRYVWIKNGEADFGKMMILEGYASEYTYNFPYKYQNEYKKAERGAHEAGKGLWADGACR